jgi:hypothetical protein
MGLGENQKRLATLSLATDPNCTAEALAVVDLTQFDCLQSFTWRGIRGDDFDLLSNFAKADRRALTTLQLDFIDWIRVEKTWNEHHRTTPRGSILGSDNFFARDLRRGTACAMPCMARIGNCKSTLIISTMSVGR